MFYQHDHEYLTIFYKKATSDLINRGFSNNMVTSFYKNALENNSVLEQPHDLSALEEKICKYVMKEN